MSVIPCPRCYSSATIKAGESPVKGKFEVYRCKKCNYVWRSTEDLSGIAKGVDTLLRQANRDIVGNQR